MCGICGATSGEIGERDTLIRAVSAMNTAQALRGPDDEGIWSDDASATVFGQRRLAIIDLSPAGHQPMSYDGGNFWITFNGEIYNFEEIKKELIAQGRSFKTKSDTEVILAGYKAWGVEVFKKMRGMFALALRDGKKKELILARDRYGIKPLITRAKKVLSCINSKSDKESRLVELRSRRGKIGFLLFGSVPLPQTTFKEIRWRGTYLKFSNGIASETKYYDSLAHFCIRPGVKRGRGFKIQEILTESVRLHLISDAPIEYFMGR